MWREVLSASARSPLGRAPSAPVLTQRAGPGAPAHTPHRGRPWALWPSWVALGMSWQQGVPTAQGFGHCWIPGRASTHGGRQARILEARLYSVLKGVQLGPLPKVPVSGTSLVCFACDPPAPLATPPALGPLNSEGPGPLPVAGLGGGGVASGLGHRPEGEGFWMWGPSLPGPRGS